MEYYRPFKPFSVRSEAVLRAANGLVNVNLGGGLIKKRVARPGQGKRNGYRTLLAFRIGARVVFLHGFAKNEKDNIGPEGQGFWRRVAKALLATDEATLAELVAAGEILEVGDE